MIIIKFFPDSNIGSDLPNYGKDFIITKNNNLANKLRIKKDREYNQEIRNFFNFYQDNFSWGSGGKEITELFEKGLSVFNSNLKELIKKYATRALAIFGENEIVRQAINRRPIVGKGVRILCMDGGGMRGICTVEMLRRIEV